MSTPQQSNSSQESAVTSQFKDWPQNIEDDLSFINPDGKLAISQPSQSQECSQYDCFVMYYRPEQSNEPPQCKQESIIMRSEQISPCHLKEEWLNSRRRSTIETAGGWEVDRRRIQQILKMEIQGWSLRLASNAKISAEIKSNPQRSNEQIAKRLYLEHNLQ